MAASAAPVITERLGRMDKSLLQATWTFTGVATETGPALSGFAEWADRSVQMTGTWNGATVLLEGSLDGTTYLPLTDPQGNNISATADRLEAITELVNYVRPRCTTGAVTALTIILLARRAQPLRT